MLAFPNACRSYDQSRRVVRFWGHQSAMEAAFFIDESALRSLDPDLRVTEDDFLRAFDAHVGAIHAAAVRLHSRGPRGAYELTAAHFTARR